ncbi:hypothetical protein IQ03_04510 [Gemmobacter caeni]|jgi:hypothetical protein|uniref:Uncharacterized protein n=1 Tax=Gemmobacter caeni TaxID=589035 RepID=A0A2T6AP52_9RHOB|nr:hypothetical protein [Gemmobacter caeni]PTX45601.1 hypothetical protein C8N34_12131 [Gemmobacter caeni]TWI93749.1 hypothetical protein IQ03_04510 [Gemmobacter caeni]
MQAHHHAAVVLAVLTFAAGMLTLATGLPQPAPRTCISSGW